MSPSSVSSARGALPVIALRLGEYDAYRVEPSAQQQQQPGRVPLAARAGISVAEAQKRYLAAGGKSLARQRDDMRYE